MHIIQLRFMRQALQDNDLSEFDESRDVIESLVDEYKACESPDYIKWGIEVCTQHVSCFSATYNSMLEMTLVHTFLQDPDHILTGEGNGSGAVDPRLAV